MQVGKTEIRSRSGKINARGQRATSLWQAALLLPMALSVSGPGGAVEQPLVPALKQVVEVATGPVEVEAGQEWVTRVTAPVFGEDEGPVLSLHAYAQAGGGCNYVLQVAVEGKVLTESLLRRRLLNKLPWFDPPNTEYHFSWYDPQGGRWMTMFGQQEPITFGGTGRDTEFLFDLTGWVASGQTVTFSFRHECPGRPAAIGKARAPLLLSDVKLGVLPQAQIHRLRRIVEGTDALKPVPVRVDLPQNARPADPPYEVVWSGRKESPRAQVAFDDLTGWTAMASGEATVSLEASVERRLWRSQLAKLSYSGNPKGLLIVLRPPAPISISEPFDAANLWLYADIDRMQEQHPQVIACLEDSAGRDLEVDLGRINNSYWVLQHGVLGREAIASVKPPIRFVGLAFSVPPVQAPRRLYLESLTFYLQNRQPFSKNTRPAKPAFPIGDDGMLPTPPPGVSVHLERTGQGATFISQSKSGTLSVRVDPEKGVFDGLSVRWNDGDWFQPMAGGELKLDPPATGATGAARLVSSQVIGGKLQVRWRQEAEWQATYGMRGRSLIVDVVCKGGRAAGLRFGRIAGLPAARAIEVPYLKYDWGQGPLIACGQEVFVSVFADWYHCEASRIVGTPTADGENLRLMTGTDYLPLTNGRRNDLRDRVLVTVSPEFEEVLPNIPNPPSPNMRRLSPFLFVMASFIELTLWKILKRYGMDHVITCDFAGFYVQDYAEGFAGRWRPHPLLTLQQVQNYRKQVKELGYLFGCYSDLRDWFPLNEWFDENCVSLNSQGDLVDGWYGNYSTKPNYLPVLARLVGQKVKANYPPDSVYMDTHTCYGPTAIDFEAGVPGAGIGRDQVYFNGDCILETRRFYGSVMSEGAVRWIYAGLADMDYASLFASQPACEMPPLVDFDLRKIHPLNLGTMMGYAPGVFFGEGSPQLGPLYSDAGTSPAPPEWYQYVATSLAYGHMMMLGYGYLPPLSRMIQLYALMQGVQKEYLTDTVADIQYHDGYRFLPTSQALRREAVKRGQVRVRYSKGLTMTVNCNAEQTWRVGGYTLPPFGWLIEKPGEILAFSALVDGRRVDYVRCPEYIYLNAGDQPVRVEAIETQGAVWLRRDGPSWRVLPCGQLGSWEFYTPPVLPTLHGDVRLAGTPADRGTGRIVLDTRTLLRKAPKVVQVEGRDFAGRAVPASTKASERLEIVVTSETVDYVLR